MGGCGGGCGCHSCGGPKTTPPWQRRRSNLFGSFARPLSAVRSPSVSSGCANGVCDVNVAVPYVAVPVGAMPTMDFRENSKGMYEWIGANSAAQDDVFEQEPQDFDWDAFYGSQQALTYKGVGVLPGGLTSAEWAAMTPTERTNWVATNARTDAQRTALVAESVRQGVDGMQAVILAIYAGENARLSSEADRIAARRRQENELELARINAERDVAIAQANATRPITANNPLSSPQPEQSAPLSTAAKVGIGVGVVGVLGLGTAIVLKVMR